MPDSGVREITEPIEMRIVDDRLHFTVVSGQRRRTYSISLHKARGAVMAAGILLDKQAGKSATVFPFEKRAGH